MAIITFRSKGLRELFEVDQSAKVAKEYKKTALMILDFLDNITQISDCYGVRDFHELKKLQRAGTYAMKVSGNWRITFKWDGKDVYDVDFEDYH